jgi:hypothetical protein
VLEFEFRPDDRISETARLGYMYCMFGFYRSRRQDDKVITRDEVASVVVVRLSLEDHQKGSRSRDLGPDPDVDAERDNQRFLQPPKAEKPRVLAARGPVD